MKMVSLLNCACFLLLWIWASFGRAWTQFDLFYMTMKIDLSMIFVMRRFTFLVFIIIWSSLYVLLLLLCVHHYHVLFSWSIFIIPWFRVWAKDPSFLTTIKRCIFIFLSLLLSNFLWSSVEMCNRKILLNTRKQKKCLVWVNCINYIKTFILILLPSIQMIRDGLLRVQENYRSSIKRNTFEMNKTLLFIIGLKPDEISPAGMKHKYE